MPRSPLLPLACALLLACSAGEQGATGVSDPSAPDVSAAGAGGRAGASGGSGQSGSSGHAGPAGAPGDCGEVGTFIFAVTEDSLLLRFDPLVQKIDVVGEIRCPGAKVGPYSMAVDRTGSALVLLHDGRLMRVSTRDASCQATSYEPNQDGWLVYGMGYVSDGPDSEHETLFVADATHNVLKKVGVERGLARLGPTLRLSSVGPFNGGLTGRLAELTGRSDGRLFAFFIQEPTIAEIDPNTAAVLASTPLPVPVPTAWAFAHWGGDFFFFVAPNDVPSRVYRYRYGASPPTSLLLEANFRVVGAGVSTCAPLSVPVVTQ